ncbi:MAG: hypothetical protein ACYDBQ_05415 [Thermoplasmatota archaeon]
MSVAVALYGHGRVGRALSCRLAPTFPVASLHTFRAPTARHAQARVVVDCTPPKYTGPEAAAWIAHLDESLRDGLDLVTCNKAPLALAWERLHAAARAGQSRILASATVGGGTPVLPLLRRLSAHGPPERVEGSLSGTLSFIACELERGATLAQAAHWAQQRGLTEPDPRLDLDGTDVRAKAVIVHNTLFPDEPVTLQAAGSLAGDVENLVRQGATPRVVATVERGRLQVGWQSAPWLSGTAPGDAVLRAHFGAHAIQISGPGAGPEATAANLLADLRELEGS